MAFLYPEPHAPRRDVRRELTADLVAHSESEFTGRQPGVDATLGIRTTADLEFDQGLLHQSVRKQEVVLAGSSAPARTDRRRVDGVVCTVWPCTSRNAAWRSASVRGGNSGNVAGFGICCAEWSTMTRAIAAA